MKPRCLVLFLFMLVALTVRAEAQNASVRVEVRGGGSAIPGAAVVVNGVASTTDDRGMTSTSVTPGHVEIVVAKEGFEPVSLSVEVRAAEERTVTVDLQPQSEIAEHVTVSATRTERGIEDEPMRVEVLDRDEIEEKLMMTPGDIVMMLNEMGGLRVQATSPSLGAASIRIQGMRGRYTRFLSDGLPLSGEQVGSFGLLQIPPVDLGRVEVIKGVASSLYGAGAMGGVVNLVSRRPGARSEGQLLVNRSTRGATDAAFWQSAPVTDRWSFAMLISANGQQRVDVDGDRWADLPKYARGVVRPRVFWDDKKGRSFFATFGMTVEERTGGTMPDSVLAATRQPYVEALNTGRLDAGTSFQTLVGTSVLSARASVTHQQLDHRYGEIVERDRHETAFAEATLRRPIGRHTLVGGVAVERDAYRPIDLPQFAYTFTVPGLFVQDDADFARWLSVSASARLDAHSEYGTFVSPRVAGLMKFFGWTSRLSYGTGFFAPTPLTEETEAAGLSRLTIVKPLKAERGRSSSWDVSRKMGPVSTTLTLFASTVHDPVEVERADRFVLANRPSPATNRGLEALVIWHPEDFSVVANYAYVRSRQSGEEVPLTPRHSIGIDGMWEWGNGKVGRLGIEWYYTGVQRLEANPYREESRPYSVFGVLVERRVRGVRLFVNGENLTDVRQTRWDPLLRPARGVDGRWTVDAWAPLDGRNINGGVRWSF